MPATRSEDSRNITHRSEGPRWHHRWHLAAVASGRARHVDRYRTLLDAPQILIFSQLTADLDRCLDLGDPSLYPVEARNQHQIATREQQFKDLQRWTAPIQIPLGMYDAFAVSRIERGDLDHAILIRSGDSELEGEDIGRR